MVLKIMDRRARFLGLDAPTKQEHGGPDGGPIPFARIERVIVDPRLPGGSVVSLDLLPT